MKRSLLIAGGSGLIGNALCQRFDREGWEVSILSRNPDKKGAIKAYLWDLEQMIVDPRALEVDVIINLAGAGIADKRWTRKRKKVLEESRLRGAALIGNTLHQNHMKVESYVGASAVGIYGDTGAEMVRESDPPGDPDFLVNLCRRWEEAHRALNPYTNHLSIVRIGPVLGRQGGLLSRLRPSMVACIGAYFGRGDQFLPWIHIDDMVSVFCHIVEQKCDGIINGVAPNPVTNKQLVRQMLSRNCQRPLTVSVPGQILKWILGDLSGLLLDGQRAMPSVLSERGFHWEYPRLDMAINQLFKVDPT